MNPTLRTFPASADGAGAAASVYFSTVACPKARVDLEKAQCAVAAAGFQIASSPEGADLAVVFTCGFIDDAKRESIADILAYGELKKAGRIGALAVVGCLPEKYGEDLAKEVPEIDVLVGNTQVHMLPSVLARLAAREPVERLLRSASFQDAASAASTVARPLPPSQPWSRTLLVCDGCNNACTYCAIPQMRGPLRSRGLGSLVEEANLLVGQGAKELVIAGQDTASYGRDRGRSELAELLRALSSRTQAHWIRLAYANPEYLDAGVARAIRDGPSVCHYVDMPIQHASPRVLRGMGRKASDAARLAVETLRAHVPDIALRSSVIVGFPGETERDFGLLMDFLLEVKFDMVGVFRFSPQPGTPAARLANRVPTSVADGRLLEVLGLQDEIARAKAEALIGSSLEVLVEAQDGGVAHGRSQYDMAEVDRLVRIKGCAREPGEFVRVRLEKYLGAYEFEAACCET